MHNNSFLNGNYGAFDVSDVPQLLSDNYFVGS